MPPLEKSKDIVMTEQYLVALLNQVKLKLSQELLSLSDVVCAEIDRLLRHIIKLNAEYNPSIQPKPEVLIETKTTTNREVANEVPTEVA